MFIAEYKNIKEAQLYMKNNTVHRVPNSKWVLTVCVQENGILKFYSDFKHTIALHYTTLLTILCVRSSVSAFRGYKQQQPTVYSMACFDKWFVLNI